MKTLATLLQLPWTIRGPREHQDPQSGSWWEIRVEELPEFFVAAASRDEVIADYREALEAFLASYTERNEEPPLPSPVRPVWQVRMPSRSRGAVSRLPVVHLTVPMLLTSGGQLRSAVVA